MTDNVIKFKPPFKENPAVDELINEIVRTVYSFEGRLSIAEALGAIEIATRRLEEEMGV